MKKHEKTVFLKIKKQDPEFGLLIDILLERKTIRKEDVKKIREITISATF